MKQLFTSLRFKMRSVTLLSSIFLMGLSINAQEYSITFSSSGVSTVLENVLVENITAGTSITLDGTDELVLNATGTITGIKELKANDKSKLTLYPNPAESTSTLTFNLPDNGNTTITIRDITGKVIITSTSYLQSGTYKYQMPVLQSGLYIVSVDSKNLKGYEKLLSISNTYGSSGLIKQIAGENSKQPNSTNSTLQKIASDHSKKQ